MVPRYEQKDMTEIWTDEFKFQTYLRVEVAILKALEKEGRIPKKTAEKVEKQASVNVDRVHEIEKTVKHDVIAFCSAITENLETDIAKYFHYGVTSSDIIDTSLTLQLKSSLDLIFPAFEECLRELYKRAEEQKETLSLGRSHGMYAEPLSFGQKLLGHYNEFARRYYDLKNFYEEELTMQASGAVGNYTLMTPLTEKQVANELALKVEPLSTQVIPRDRIAKMVQLNSLLACAIERLAVEIRHLHHSDVGELHEGFTKGQKGSSIMPHKKNPISSENLTGIARILRSHSQVAMDNVVLWHERDISHSSAERLYLPDHFGLLLYALRRLTGTLEKLVFHEETIQDKVTKHVTYLSSYYLHELINQSDLRREKLYELLQRAAFKASETAEDSAKKAAEVYYDELLAALEETGIKDVELKKPTFEELKRIYTSGVDEVFKRSLKSYPLP